VAIRKITAQEQKTLYNRLLFAEGANYNDWVAECEKNIKYYFNNQWSAKELAAKSKKGDYVIQINKLRKAINAMTGLLTANRPQYHCAAVGVEDSYKAEGYNKILDNVWRVSNGLEKYRSAFKSGLRDNIGYLFVSPNANGDVGFENLCYSDVIVDPRSKSELFDDAEYIYIVKWVSIEQAMARYNLEAAAFTQSRPREWKGGLMDSMSKKALVGKLIDDSKTHVKIYEGFRKVHRPVFDHINGQDIVIGSRTTIQMQSIVGYWHVDEVDMPMEISHYPIIPFFAEQVDNPYKIGEIPFLMELQDYINSAMGVLLKNASINSDPKIIMAQDAVNGNLQDFAANYTNGSSINFVETAEDLNSIKVINGQPINGAFLQLMNILSMEFEKQSIPSDVIGYKDSSLEARGAILEKREAVMDSMKLIIGHCDAALNRLGVVCIQYAQGFMRNDKLEKILNKTDIEKALEGLPKINVDDPAAVQAYTNEAIQGGANTFEVEKQINDIKVYKEKLKAIGECIRGPLDEVDIAVIPKSYSPSYDMMQFNTLLMMKQAGILIPDDTILEHAPVEGSKDIAKQISIVERATKQNAFLQDELERVQAELDKTTLAMIQGQQDKVLQELAAKSQKRIDDSNNKAYTRKKVDGIASRMDRVIAKKDMAHKAEMIVTDLKHEMDMASRGAQQQPSQPQSIKELIRNK